MKSVSLSSPRHLAGTVKPSMLDGLARRIVLRQLERLEHGRLRLTDGTDSYLLRFGGPQRDRGPHHGRRSPLLQ